MPDLMTQSDFDLGRTALLEITSAESIGANAGSIDEGDGVTTVYFETLLSGYPGWRWTVSIAHVDGVEPGVLETELTPGDGALLSPAWIPWVDRLADLRAAEDALGADDSTDDDDDDESDDDDDDESDETDDDESDDEDADDSDDDSDDEDDDLGSDILHSGDVDGVDIDDVDPEDIDGSDDDDPEDIDGSDDDESDDDDDESDDDERERSF